MRRENYIQGDPEVQAIEWLKRTTAGVRERSALQLHPSRCALLVVDMNRYFADSVGTCYLPSVFTIIPQIAKLLAFFRGKGGNVVFARHGHAGPDDVGMFGRFFNSYIDAASAEAQIIEALEPVADEVVIDKNSYDAFLHTPLESVLKAGGVTQVLICGVLTHMCVETTARSAFCRGFEVYVPVDAVAADNLENHISSLRVMAQTVAILNTVSGFLARFPDIFNVDGEACSTTR